MTIRHDSPILIICALKVEAAGIVHALKLSSHKICNVPVFLSDRIYCAIPGIGSASIRKKVPSLIECIQPRTILNVGSAGALNQSITKGMMYEITRVIQIDQNASPSEPIEIEAGTPFPTASLATSRKPVVKDDERQSLGIHADLVDMEGYAIAGIARARNIPVHIIKIVSDVATENDENAIRHAII
ncbi:MAG TPA: hypothetical protein VF857_11680, partial [Spirochaetota bacterium]